MKELILRIQFDDKFIEEKDVVNNVKEFFLDISEFCILDSIGSLEDFEHSLISLTDTDTSYEGKFSVIEQFLIAQRLSEDDLRALSKVIENRRHSEDWDYDLVIDGVKTFLKRKNISFVNPKNQEFDLA